MHVDTTAKTEIVPQLDAETQFILQTLIADNEVKSDSYVHLDMDRLIYILDCHRLSIVFYSKIKDSAFSPLSATARLKNECAANKLRMLTYMAELCRVVKLLQSNNINTISLKGPVLGQLYYDDYTERACNDLDILVSPGDLEAAYQVLLNLGYTLTEPLWTSTRQKTRYQKTFHHYHLYNKANDIQLELHWKLVTSISNATRIENIAWANLTIRQIGGISVPVLNSVDNFIYLCIHGCTHDWKRLFWVLDIAQIIKKEGPAFLTIVYGQAAAQQVDRYVIAGCHMAAVLFGSSLPPNISQAISADPRMAGLSANFIFLINQIAAPYQNPLSSFPAFRLGVKKLLVFYQSTFFLGGVRAVRSAIRRFFINPDYWAIYSFSDKFFALNYIAAPCLWVYSTISRSRK